MLQYKIVKLIDNSDFDQLVQDTYKKPYRIQQTEGCLERQCFSFKANKDLNFAEDLPKNVEFDYEGEGVDFETWVNTPYTETDDYRVNLFWERSFHPYFNDLVLDLCKKGLIKEGEYSMKISW